MHKAYRQRYYYPRTSLGRKLFHMSTSFGKNKEYVRLRAEKSKTVNLLKWDFNRFENLINSKFNRSRDFNRFHIFNHLRDFNRFEVAKFNIESRTEFVQSEILNRLIRSYNWSMNLDRLTSLQRFWLFGNAEFELPKFFPLIEQGLINMTL